MNDTSTILLGIAKIDNAIQSYKYDNPLDDNEIIKIKNKIKEIITNFF